MEQTCIVCGKLFKQENKADIFCSMDCFDDFQYAMAKANNKISTEIQEYLNK